MIDLLNNTYRDKKVFLTGHTGFKGSWMLTMLNLIGADVKGYALDPEDDPSLFKLLEANELCDSVIADVRDKEKLEKELVDFQPDFIFHFAAQSLVRRSYRDPLATFGINVMGTANLLDAVRKLDKKCQVIVITTDKVYENLEKNYAYAETDKLGGFDPYSSSKACAEIVASTYRLSFFNSDNYEQHKKSIATARSGNVIGGGDWCEDRIIPDMIRALNSGEKLEVRNPNAVRPWQHVMEPLGGYLLLGARMAEDPVKYADAFNFGPNLEDDLSVEELVKIALEKWGNGEYEVASNPDDPHEAGLLQLNIDKAEKILGWKPQLNSKEAIAKTIDWYKNYKDNPRQYTEQQIQHYFQQ